MERPFCKLCRHKHYSTEPHVWASKDFTVLAPVVVPPVEAVPSRGGPYLETWSPADVVEDHGTSTTITYVAPPGTASVSSGSTQSRENRSRYRSPESAQAYRDYMKDYMSKKRAR